MKIKIVLIVEAMLGGIRQHVCDIVRSLDKEIYEVYMIYSDLRADETFFAEKEELAMQTKLIQCNEMQRELGLYDIKAYKKIKRILKQIKPNIVHCHSSKAGVVGRLAAKNCGINKILYTPGAYVFQNPNLSDVKRKVYVYAERLLSRYATSLTINVSRGEMQKAFDFKIDKKEKFKLIYNGIPQIEFPDRAKLKKELGLKEGITYVGVTARCADQKDPFTFLRIAEQVVKKYRDVEFIYIGDGPLEEKMKNWITERKLSNQIHMLGFRNNASILVSILDIYLSTALYEGLPYSMIEAMRAGVPIIATNVVGNNELVVHNVNGFMFDIKDVQYATTLIEQQIIKKTIRSEQVINAWKELFSLEKMMEKLTRLYFE